MIGLCDRSILILGLGETGLSLVRWLSAQGARLRVADTRAAPPGLKQVRELVGDASVHCGSLSDELLQGIERIAISPGVPVAEPLVQKAIALGIPVEGDIELLAQVLDTNDYRRNTKVIAITGANGKTTVTGMVGAMCKAVGLDAEVAGNISPAVLDALSARNHQPQVWVLELSSFQLETTYTLNADAATVLNVTEDHLDRYEGMDAYTAAKARIFQGNGVQILNREDVRSREMALSGRKQVSFGLDAPISDEDWGIAKVGDVVWLMQGKKKVMRADELQVSGLHNVANALAALALCRSLNMPLAPLVQVLREFKGLPHRVEFVAEIDGVSYFDDSKGTNVGATEAALKGLGVPTVVILGGDGKGQDFSPLKEAVANHARAAVLIGRDAGVIAKTLEGCGRTVLRAKDMADAVQLASSIAEKGDAVLLSPACASFDMFRNYEHRAEVFIAAVQSLRKEVA